MFDQGFCWKTALALPQQQIFWADHQLGEVPQATLGNHKGVDLPFVRGQQAQGWRLPQRDFQIIWARVWGKWCRLWCLRDRNFRNVCLVLVGISPDSWEKYNFNGLPWKKKIYQSEITCFSSILNWIYSSIHCYDKESVEFKTSIEI